MTTTVTLAAVVALKNDDPVTFSERRAWVNVVDDSDALVAEVVRIVGKLKIVRCPDSRSLEADGREGNCAHAQDR